MARSAQFRAMPAAEGGVVVSLNRVMRDRIRRLLQALPDAALDQLTGDRSAHALRALQDQLTGREVRRPAG